MTPIEDCLRSDDGSCFHQKSRQGSLLKKLGPGFVTGASDDDPSGLATYAQAGASWGPSILWLAPWLVPLMVSVQEMAGRIGLMTQGGLAQSFLRIFSRWTVYALVGCLVIANTINIGADIAGMAESVQMVSGIPFFIAATVLAIGMMLLQIYLPYKRYVNILKWCTVSLFSYIIAAFIVNMNFSSTFWHTLIPTLKPFDNNFWYILTAILGTTISPYLLFWQSNQEIEEKKLRDDFAGKITYAITECELAHMRSETWFGMIFSNIIMFFVMATTAAVIFSQGGKGTINTMVEAAEALRPLAGDFAAWLFTVGIIGTGLLAVPVLAGSSAYAMAEMFGWKSGLHLKWHEAKEFYGVIAASTLVGLAMNALHINAVDFLLWSAVINGLVTPIIIFAMILVANNEKLMGRFKNTFLSKLGGIITLVVFVGVIVAFLVTYKK